MVGVGGSLGGKVPVSSGFESSQLYYRNEVFDTGVPCCAADPIVPLSLMFKYNAPVILPGQRFNDRFIKLNLFRTTSVTSQLAIELGWNQPTTSSPLGFEIVGSQVSGSSGNGQSAPVGDLIDEHWYRFVGMIGQDASTPMFYYRIEDFGTDGTSRIAVLNDGVVALGSGMSVNGTYAGFFAATNGGAGAVAVDEFHTTFGDFNSDGVVDAADYVFWRDRYGTRNQRANHSGDTRVDEVDLQIWRKGFGRSAVPQLAGGGAGIAVPEPSFCSTLLLCLLITAARGRRR